MFTVYILYSNQYQKIYIGFTYNLIERFKSHNILATKGWTVRYRPWVVVYCEHFLDKPAALEREKALKGGKGRAWIHQQIKNQLPEAGFISA